MPFSYKMQETTFRWLLNLLLAMSIYLSASLGRLLGIQSLPLNLTPVWPPTGFSLAALLMLSNRAWPGVFFGNFVYNFIHLYASGETFIGPLLTALLITSGSLAQALVGWYVIRRYAESGYFNSVKDSIIFLAGGGLFTCMIAATVAVVTFYFYGVLPGALMPFTWVTMWLGDSMGVYIFTPLLVEWILRAKSVQPLSRYPLEALLQLFAFIVVSFIFLYLVRYPAIYLYVPLSLWITYRFRLHGITIAIFFISLLTVLGTAFGMGSFALDFASSPFLALVSFLQILVMINMVLGAVLNERDAAWNLVQMRDVSLSEAVRMHLAEMKEMGSEMVHKEKLSALTTLLSAMASRLEEQLKKVGSLVERCKQALKERLAPDAAPTASTKGLEEALDEILILKDDSRHLASHMARCTPERMRMKPTDINELVESCVNREVAAFAEQYPKFSPKISKELGLSLEKIYALPEDLTQALAYYIRRALLAMIERQDRGGYTPILKVATLLFSNRVKIEMQHNGAFDQTTDLAVYFQSLMHAKERAGSSDLESAIAHDTIVLLHGGELNVSLSEEDFLQISIILPKSPYK